MIVNDVPGFQVYHELMLYKIREILLVSSPYDAFIMEEDGSLASRIVGEYQGLNLSHPPRLQRIHSAVQALEAIKSKKFDLVITMPHLDDMDASSFGREIKKIAPDLPVVLLAHSLQSVVVDPERQYPEGIDHFFIWSTDPTLLLAIVKNVEDHLNVARDTEKAKVRVLILVEDSPLYRSFMLPLLYREIVKQTQAVLVDSLNYEHRLLKMRARPKILVAQNFEDALNLYKQYRPYVFGIMADGGFPRQDKLDPKAGLLFLQHIRSSNPDLPLLLMSAEPSNREPAHVVPAVFLDKNSPTLTEEIRSFLLNQLGFGNFVFRLPDGTQVGWADNFRTFEEKITVIPEESLLYHASRNHFANWIMARSEVDMAIRLRKMTPAYFSTPEEMRSYLVNCVHSLRKIRQQGVVVRFSKKDFDDQVMDFVKIGSGSIGGKGRGLAFMEHHLAGSYSINVDQSFKIKFPKTLVISSEGFDAFVNDNGLQIPDEDRTDAEIASEFLAGAMPEWLLDQLTIYLSQVTGPLSIRSSSLMEDAQYRPYAGLFSTYMLPNNHGDFSVRLRQFLSAIQLVYASTWFSGPRAFFLSTGGGGSSDDSMAVIVQQMVGSRYGDYFYPGISGVAQSHNFYPVSHMLPEEGIAHIALGLGKTVVEGEKCIRFSPIYPQILPQFSTVDDILAHCQRFFYALKMTDYPENVVYSSSGNLARREVNEASAEFPIKLLASSYISEEHRIRDGNQPGALNLLTFAKILKYNLIPVPEIITNMLELGRNGMGCPVEIEFAVDIKNDPEKSEFYFLQMRPMVVGGGGHKVDISQHEIEQSFCRSEKALGHGVFSTFKDIVFVDPIAFEPAKNREVAREIGAFNKRIQAESRTYLLIGPGRWGSADHWLGIPVQWQDISAVGAIIELRNKKLRADASQGSHFFHNITSMGIPYVTVDEEVDYIDWDWLKRQPVVQRTGFLCHVRCSQEIVVKISATESKCVMVKPH